MSTVSPAPLRGVIPAMVTPATDDGTAVDLGRVRGLVQYQLAAGVHGLFPGSSTGEAPLLSREDRSALIETVVVGNNGRVPVLAGVGSPSTRLSIQYARDAEKSGATYLVVLPMHFVPVSADELYNFFAAVADSVSIPTLLYNYPSRCAGQNITPAVAARLVGKHNVIGVKDSGSDFSNTLGYLDACGPEFLVFTGNESLLSALLASGGAGTICAAGNVIPAELCALYAAWEQGNEEKMRALQAMISSLRPLWAQGTFPAAVKMGVNLRGVPVGIPFPPALPLSEAMAHRIEERLRELEEPIPALTPNPSPALRSSLAGERGERL